MPPAGRGHRSSSARATASGSPAGVLALLLLLMFALLRLDLAYRLRSTSPTAVDGGSPEPMV